MQDSEQNRLRVKESVMRERSRPERTLRKRSRQREQVIHRKKAAAKVLKMCWWLKTCVKGKLHKINLTKQC